MDLTVKIAEKTYRVDINHPLDISIALNFSDPQVKVFGSAPASKESFKSGDFIGSVRLGGSCNCEVLHLCPHTHGTHTECVGHILDSDINICDVMKNSFLPSTLITVPLCLAKDNRETYTPELRDHDQLITFSELKKSLTDCHRDFLRSLVIRTLPNKEEKKTCNYDQSGSAFFTHEAMHFLNELGVEHLLVDTPSIDRLDDEGLLSNHRLFWNLGKDSLKTITELIYIPSTIVDGCYLLNLQIAPFKGDASPSRPLLFAFSKLHLKESNHVKS